MYSVSIPINCNKFHRIKDKQLILDELRAFDADRVMLNFEDILGGHIVLYKKGEYQSAEFLCGSGKLCGDKVCLTDIPPFAFRGIVLKKIDL